MASFCKYHPSQAAHFVCERCDTHLCPECVSLREHKLYNTIKTAHFCPICNIPLQSLGVGHLIAPFWTRLPQFFLYPFKGHALFLIIAMAAVGIFLGNSILFLLFSTVILIKYSYAALTSTAQGRLSPPELGGEMINADISPAFKQLGLIAINAFLFFWIAQSLGQAPALIFLLLAVLGIPAMIMILACSNSVLKAINPLVFVPVIWRVGWPYLLMYFFLILLYGAPSALAYYLFKLLPDFLARFLTMAGQQYYTIMCYNLMGYVLLQYHEVLGYQVNYEDFVSQLPVTKKGCAANNDKPLTEVDILIKEGKFDEALAALQRELQQNSQDKELAGRYYKLLKAGGKQQELINFAPDYLKILLAANDKKTIRQVYKECLKLNGKLPLPAEALYHIAATLNKEGDPQSSLAAYLRITKEHPKHELLPDSYFHIAKLLNERLGKPEQAREILTVLIRKFTNHDIGRAAKAYTEGL
ncbi:MAG: tetratricopeptide repeat protein [Desulfobulbaceae bacterium]|nr:tetratricopeptide repeat protein [Desulfobulbaceae bacterium]HIJ78693.1 tetratricopeptide repeat protein [Deltaproteobacteria bacterium]